MMRTPLIVSFCLYYFVFGVNISLAQESKQPSPKLMLPIGNRLEVLSAQFSPDGKKIVTASADKTALVWDAVTGNLLFDINDHKSIVSAAEFSPDGKKILTASYDNMVKVWDAATGEHLFTLKGHKDSIFTAHFSPDSRKIVSASADGTAKLWDAVTKRLISDLSGHDARVNTAQFSPDGTMIVSASANGTTAIWDVKTGMGKYLGGKPEDQHIGSVTSAQFSRDNKYVVTGSEDRTLKIWDVSSGKLLKTLSKHTDKINFVQFSPDGRKIVSASRDKTAKIWNVTDGRVLWDLPGHTSSVKSAQFTPDGKKIITTSFDFTARIWDVATGNQDTVLNAHKRTVWSVAFSPDSTKFVTASYDGTAKVWDIASAAMLADLKGHTNWVYGARLSPDGKKIVTATDDSNVKVWDAMTGKLLMNLIGRSGSVLSAQFSPDGKKIVATYKDSTVKIWDAGTGDMKINFSTRKQTFKYVDFSAEGKKMLLVTGKDSIKIYDTFTYDTIFTRFWHEGVVSAKFSPDGSRVITASAWDSTAKIWDTKSGKLLNTLSGHEDEVLFADYSPDNTKIVTTSQDHTAIIWNAATMRRDTILIGHSDPVIYASFSPDSKKVVTASEDKSARMWDVKSGKQLFKLKEHTDWVNTAQFDSTGKKIITASGDNTVKVWNTDNGKILYSFFAVDSADYLIVDAYNHFDGSENARNLLYFTCGTEVVSLDQVKDELWVPNLAELLNNGDTSNQKSLDDLDICGLTPEVEKIADNGKVFQFKITPRHGGLGETVLFVNGIEAKRYPAEYLKNNNYQLNIAKDSISNYFMTAYENRVMVKAYTSDGLISSAECRIVIEKNVLAVATPKLYGIMVGVGEYKGEGNNLKFAPVDAADISNAVADAAGKLLGKEHVFMFNMITGKENSVFPEKKNIKKVLEEIGNKATADDILFIFLSGHGVKSEKNKQFYYMTAGSDPDDETNYQEMGISSSELAEWIKPQNIKAQKRILILDACYSGQAINNVVITGDVKQGLILKADATQIKAIDKLNEKSGLFILSAAGSDQRAWEDESVAHGYLTYSLLKAIKLQPDILEEDSLLNVSRWLNAASKTVAELANAINEKMRTQIVSTTDFYIGVVDNAVMANIKLSEEKIIFAGSNFQNADPAVDGDDLGLRKTIDQVLKEISAKDKDGKIVYNMAASSPDAYTLTGKYEVKGNKINVKVSVRRGDDKDAKYKFEETGTINKLKELADMIVAKVTEWVTANK